MHVSLYIYFVGFVHEVLISGSSINHHGSFRDLSLIPIKLPQD